MFDVKIAVGKGFEFWIKRCVVTITDILELSMKICRFILSDVMWRPVYPSTKPSDLIVKFEIPDIHVDNGHEGITGVEHNGNAGSKKVLFVHLKRPSNLIGQYAVHCGKIHASFLNYSAVLNNPRTPTAAASACPKFFHKRRFSIQV